MCTRRGPGLRGRRCGARARRVRARAAACRRSRPPPPGPWPRRSWPPARPGDTDAPGTWAAWARLLPHLLALDPATSGNPGLRWLASSAARYLIMRGDFRGGHDLASGLYPQWSERLGPDDPITLSAGHALGYALLQMGRFGEARQVNEDNLARCRRVLGDDHPHTLTSASNLAADLRALGETGDGPG